MQRCHSGARCTEQRLGGGMGRSELPAALGHAGTDTCSWKLEQRRHRPCIPSQGSGDCTGQSSIERTSSQQDCHQSGGSRRIWPGVLSPEPTSLGNGVGGEAEEGSSSAPFSKFYSEKLKDLPSAVSSWDSHGRNRGAAAPTFTPPRTLDRHLE